MPVRPIAAFILILAAAALGCAGRAWERASDRDTAAAYAEFLRDHPGSEHAQEAKERSALVRVRNHPTTAGYEAFRKRFPDSELIAELKPIVEEAFFLRARMAGTADAYRAFLDEFEAGQHAARARGNAEYLEARGFAGSPAALAGFASSHPESDFAPEALRTARAVEVRGGSRFRRVGLVMDVDPSTPGADRVGRHFRDLALRAYQASGMGLIPLQGATDPRAAELPALLRIRHVEGHVRTRIDDTTLSTPGLLATTTLTLWRPGSEQPIWSRTFLFRAVAAAREDTSIIFGPGTQTYWREFFVPVATWTTQVAVRSPSAFEQRPVALEALAGRAVVLFENGDLEILDLADPEAPARVGEYRRPRDLTKWSDLRLLGDHAVIFGGDGIEVVQLSAEGARLVAVHDRSAVGTIHAVEALKGALVTAGKRGLQLVPDEGGAPERLVDREILGLVRAGDRLIFTDGTSLFVSSVDLLRKGRVEAKLRLGTGFGPGRLRLAGSDLVVLGRRGVVRVDLTDPGKPRLVSRIEMSEVGQVHDALQVGGRLFLLGARGLQLTDGRGERVVDSADVAARTRLGFSGRHLVLVGDTSLQVVDATPFVAAGGTAAVAE